MSYSLLDYEATLLAKAEVVTRRGELVLDVGCGNGRISQRMAVGGAFLIGFDLQQSASWQCPRVPNRRSEFLIASALRMPFADGIFHLVFAKDVLHHVQDPDVVLSEVDRVVRIGGRIIIVEPNRYNPIFYVHLTVFGGHNHLSRPKFIRLIRKYFPSAQFRYFETRVYVIAGRRLCQLLHLFEYVMERTPVLRHLTTYSAAQTTKT